MKKIIVSTLVLIMVVAAWSQQSPVFVTDDGALRGYDVVAFFQEQKPVLGSKTITHAWNGAVWHFVSEENKNTFAADPEKYAPQYGGYCAYGMSNGYKAPTQIDTWTIVDGKLYFNYNKQVQKDWNSKQAELIQKANQNWPTVKDRP